MRTIVAFVSAILALCFCATATFAADTVTITDVVGRQVTVKRPVKRIILGEGRQILALGLIHPNPVSLLAGWPDDLKRQDKVTYSSYAQKFPELDAVPVIGRGNEATFSIEQALATNPDVAILSGGYGPSAKSGSIIERFNAAGVPVVFVDFVAKPLENTLPSIKILGQLLGEEKRAEEFTEFYRSRMQRIAGRLAEAKPVLPKVFMHAHAGAFECCNSPGRATVGAFIDAAGGHNIAADVLSQAFGQLNLEYVLQQDPDVYVGTGGIHLEGTGGLVLGPGVSTEKARQLLQTIADRPAFSGMSAVRNGRVYGIWHLFSNAPFNVIAVEVLAKWFHPALFKDVDPDGSLRELNERFLPVPMTGTYWIALK
jgi:iron complex transport system substrate-binding protein